MVYSSTMTIQHSSSTAEMRAWLAKYSPVEQAIFAEREKRLARKARRREERQRRFGDLCEATEGLAVRWRRERTPLARQLAWADGDVFTVACILRAQATRRAERVRHALKRPLYYSAENARRRALAAERRCIRRRTTENPCPTREAILDAWIHRRDSHAAAIRFGSLIEDLECYLDNSLRFDENGNLVGRNGGIKRWLQTAIPALYLRYTTVMRFKAAARKLRQIVGVQDPIPAVRIVDSVGVQDPIPPVRIGDNVGVQDTIPAVRIIDNVEQDPIPGVRIIDSARTTKERASPDVHSTPVTDASRIVVGVQAGKNSIGPITNTTRTANGVTVGKNTMSNAIVPDLVRAHAKWLEMTQSLAPNNTSLFACIDEQLAFSGSGSA